MKTRPQTTSIAANHCRFELSFLLFFCLCFVFAHGNESSSCLNGRRVTLRHVERGGVGYTTGYTTLEAFLSSESCLSKVVPFFDARGHIFDNGSWAANGGVGLRKERGRRIYGMNLYYDYRGTKHLSYHQASVGFETLGTLIDARLNGYFPFYRKTSSPYDTKFGYFSGHSLFLSQKVEFAMTGVDAEVGFHLGHCDFWNFYASIGPYYFHGPGGPNAWGGKVRASCSYQDWITLEVVESYDNFFHNHVQGQIGFSIPLGPKMKRERVRKLDCRKVQRVARNEIIVLGEKHKYPIAINPLTGAPYYFVFVNNTSSSKGTFESPYPSLAIAQSNSAPNQVLYVFSGDGTTRNMDQGVVLQAGQKFWGSGTLHPLQTAQGLITVPPMTVTMPQITNNNLLGVGAVLSTNNEISGIVFTETDGSAVTGTDPVSFTLSSCTITACGQHSGLYPVSLDVSSPFTANFTNNLFTSNLDAGILVNLFSGASATQITMNNNEAYNNLANSGNVGILNISAHGSVGSCQLEMSKNIFENNDCGMCNITCFDTPHDGTFTSFQGTFTQNTSTGSTQASAITFSTNADTCLLTIQGNELSNNTHGSILVTAGADGTQAIQHCTIVIDSNQLNGGGSAGDAINIQPQGNTLSIVIQNNSIMNNQGSGFVSYFQMAEYPNATLSIINNVISGNQNVTSNASGGIAFDQFNSVFATIERNTFSNNVGGSSIGKYGGPTPSTSSVVLINNHFSENDTFEFDFYGNDPSTGCLTLTGNTNTTSPGYLFSQNGTGSCFIVPCDYAAQNTGDVTLSDTIQVSSNCSGGSCP